MKMNYLEPPTKNKRRQQRRRQKYRSLQAKALHEGRNGQFRHRVFDTDRVTRVSSSLLIKEYFNDEQEEQRLEDTKEISHPEDRLSDEDGSRRDDGAVVEDQETTTDREGSGE